MNVPPLVLSLNSSRSLCSLAYGRWLEASQGHAWAIERYHDTSSGWAETISRAAKVMELLSHINEDAAVLGVKTKDGTAALMVEYFGLGDWMIRSTGSTEKAAKAAIDAFVNLAPAREADRSDWFDVHFWAWNPALGASRSVRSLPRLEWSAIQENYPAAVRGELESLVSLKDQSPKGGRLMVFYGSPGTGKTKYLQCLGTEWASWADVHYVTDPDMLFATASYMSQVAIARADDHRWRLLVCEDADEYIDERAKAKVGQGVARLLNIADGLIGSGLKLMVLASTNVRSARFSPAVVRPGRCGALIKFPAFTSEEASSWLAAHGAPGETVEEKATLADLYGRIS